MSLITRGSTGPGEARIPQFAGITKSAGHPIVASHCTTKTRAWRLSHLSCNSMHTRGLRYSCRESLSYLIFGLRASMPIRCTIVYSLSGQVFSYYLSCLVQWLGSSLFNPRSLSSDSISNRDRLGFDSRSGNIFLPFLAASSYERELFVLMYSGLQLHDHHGHVIASQVFATSRCCLSER